MVDLVNTIHAGTDQVRSIFERPERYLRWRDFNIRIRAEVVQELVGERAFSSMLDIGCGNGAISLPLLRQGSRLTLLDFSSNMLSLARSLVPERFAADVQTIHEDFMAADLPLGSYDLILCLGVLAHVDAPAEVLAKIVSLLAPGGSVIVQNTDSGHPVSYLSGLYKSVRNALRPARATRRRTYVPAQLSNARLKHICQSHGLVLVARYHYNEPPPGMARTNEEKYAFIRAVYGNYTRNHLAWLGRESLLQFSKPV
jgi:SAM-dependent methyltransferase